jgi:hypothetical protein
MHIVIRPDLKSLHRREEELSIKPTCKQSTQEGTYLCTRDIPSFDKSIPTTVLPRNLPALLIHEYQDINGRLGHINRV